jgi:hypothetical protein
MVNYPKYVIRRSKDYQFYWVLNAINGRALITSETYTSKEACKNGIDSSRKNVADSNFQRKTSSNGWQHYFNQIAGNYQVLGTSEMYNSKEAMEDGISAVKRDAPKAGIEDLS